MELISIWFLFLTSPCVFLPVIYANFQSQKNENKTVNDTTNAPVTSKITDEDYNTTLSGNLLKNLPDSWEDFCFLEGSKSKNNTLHYNCYIDDASSGKWNFEELRKYMSLINEYYSFKVKCEHGAKISLPQPGKSKNIVKLHVHDCIATDYYADYKNPELDTFPDVMEEYVLINVQIEIGHKAIKEHASLNLSSLPKNLVCGDEETLKILIKRNYTFTFVDDMPIDLIAFGKLGSLQTIDFRHTIVCSKLCIHLRTHIR